MDAKTAGKLVATGLGFGCVHVLTGADHLSALATLSVGSRFRAFSLGIRWGVGHSTGLILVAGVLLGLDDKVDPTKLEHYCNWIVGVFMIALGLWGVYKAFKHKRLREAEQQGQGQQEMAAAGAALEEGEGAVDAGQVEEGRVVPPGGTPAAAAPPPPSSGSGARVQTATITTTGGSNTASSDGGAWSSAEDDERDEEEIVRLPINGREQPDAAGPAEGGLVPTSSPGPTAAPISPRRGSGAGATKAATPTREPLIFLDEECESVDHAVVGFCKRRCRAVNIESPLVQRIVAFTIGIVHGIAGPGGILGVLPAVQLHSWQKASLYLGTFCFASTMIMGIFAALYGELSSRIGSAKKIEFQIELFSAALSIIVGILWIALIIAGKLNVVFG